MVVPTAIYFDISGRGGWVIPLRIWFLNRLPTLVAKARGPFTSTLWSPLDNEDGLRFGHPGHGQSIRDQYQLWSLVPVFPNCGWSLPYSFEVLPPHGRTYDTRLHWLCVLQSTVCRRDSRGFTHPLSHCCCLVARRCEIGLHCTGRHKFKTTCRIVCFQLLLLSEHAQRLSEHTPVFFKWWSSQWSWA